MARKPKKEITYLTEEEVDAFFRVIREPRDKALFRVMYHHALRASEPGKTGALLVPARSWETAVESDTAQGQCYGSRAHATRSRVERTQGVAAGARHRSRTALHLAQARSARPSHGLGADETLLHPGRHTVREGAPAFP
jgi:hypothetical protein